MYFFFLFLSFSDEIAVQANSIATNETPRSGKLGLNCMPICSIKRALRVMFVGRTGAVVSVADYGPRGPWSETWLRHSLL